LERTVKLGIEQRKRNRGCPKARRRDDIMKVTGLSLYDLKESARDRIEWWKRVRYPDGHNGTR